MVEVRTSRLAVEVLAAEGTVLAANRVDVQVAANMAGTTEVQVSRVAIEVLGAEPDVMAASRVDVQVAASMGGTAEVQASRLSLEVLAGEPSMLSASRIDVQVAASMAGTTEVQASRIAIEVLARQGSAGLVAPLALIDDSKIFLHNWATRAEMSTSFRNDVRRSPETGAEARLGLGIKPLRSMKLQWMVCDDLDLNDLERLEVMLRRIGNARFQVPIYMDQKITTATFLSAVDTILVDTSTARFFPGARVAIVEVNFCGQPTGFSFHTIDSLTNASLTFTAVLGQDIEAGAYVFPVMDCEIALDVKASFTTARVPIVSLTVIEVPGASQLPALKSDIPTGAETYAPTTLTGELYPIWFEEPDWTTGITKGRDRAGRRGTGGRADFVSTEATRSRQTHSYTITGKRAEMWNALVFFETRRGRLRAFWHIDQDQYMETVELDATGTFVGVSEIGDIADFQEEFDFVGLVMNDGRIFVRRAVTIQEVLTKFRITVDTPVDTNMSVANVHRLARARLTRFAKDEFTEIWSHTGYMSARVSFIEVLDEDDYSTT